MRVYNQRLNSYSRLGCTLYSLFTILEYNYGIVVKNNFILKALHYFEKLGKWSPLQGAVFNIIYPAFTYAIKKKLGLDFRIYKTYVNAIRENDTLTYGIGVKKYCKPFAKAEDRGKLTKENVDSIVSYKGPTYMHNLTWDGSNGGYIINTDGTRPFKCSLTVLKYMLEKDIIWSPMRTILPNDIRTRRITDITKAMAKAEFQGKTFKILKKDYDIKEDILKLYNYGK